MDRMVLFVSALRILASSSFAAPPRAEQEKAVAAIERLGGKVTFDETRPGKPVVGVDFTLTRASNADLHCLTPLTQLRSLSLGLSEVTGNGLGRVAGLAELEELNFVSMNVGLAEMERLAACPGCEVWASRAATSLTPGFNVSKR